MIEYHFQDKNGGDFSFICIPFVLINAKSTFQRETNVTFRGLIGQSVVVYLDDVIVFLKKISDHLHHLKQIFGCYRKYGISLNPKTRIFVMFEGNLLGHIIEKSGITVDPKCVKAIMQISYFNDKREMQSLLGNINFF